MALREKFRDIAFVDELGNIEYVNMNNPDFFELKLEEMVGKRFTQVYNNIDENTSTFMRAINKGERFVNYVQMLETRSGKLIKQEEDIYLLKNGDKIVGAVEFADYDEDRDTLMLMRQDRNIKSFEQATIDDIIGNCEEIVKLKNKINKIIDKESPILLIGETGTGKELAARAIHNCSIRKDAEFVYVNCGALPESLLEGILFGTKKGSFTDAEEKRGLFQLADKGTLFLDEIDSMPLAVQAKLLRAIEENCIRPIGSSEEIYLDVRIIASCNIDIDRILESHYIRSDLLFRLSVIQFTLPPLRNRGDDILLIANYYIERFNKEYKKDITGMEPELEKMLLNHRWFGNVRELQNMLEGIYPMLDGERITAEMVLRRWNQIEGQRLNYESQVAKDFLTSGMKLNDYLETCERENIVKALDIYDNDIHIVSKKLGLSIQLLKYKIEKYGLK